ncbi:hybrid sensor histidine kinase/response regulator [Fulvitalea axinellae]|uniref:Hybrid sensor histidine kinase/response regulator n=1 Tax=Fulvitalea axinellae TaxID=1182444 RepID=A0AAU9C894_9BACT|nr:hybrid sensor histidine kinase/response regulator [Fulvitalea axinellae]
MTRKFTICLLLFTCFSSATASDFGYTVMKSLQTQIPDLRGSQVMEDKNGFIWIATFSSLLWYDGTEVRTVFESDSDMQIRNAIYQKKKNRIWLATTKGLKVFDINLRKTVTLAKGPLAKDIFQQYAIGLCVQDGNVWIATPDGRLVRWQGDTGKCQTALKNRPTGKRIYHGALQIGTDTSGNVLFSDWSKRLFRIRPGKSTPEPFKILTAEGKTSPTDLDLKRLYRSSKGDMFWVTNHGLASEDKNGNFRIHQTPNEDLNYYASVSSISDDGKNLYLGTGAYGLRYANLPQAGVFKTSALKHAKIQLSVSDSRTRNNHVGGLTFDSRGNLWLTIPRWDILVLRPETGLFSDRIEGLPPFKIMASCKAENGKVWFATFENGLLLYDPIKKSYKAYRPNSEGYKEKRFSEAFKASDGTCWFGSRRGSLYRYIASQDRFESRNLALSKSPTIGVKFINEDRYGNIWCVCEKRRLWKISPDMKSAEYRDAGGSVHNPANILGFAISKDGWLVYNNSQTGPVRFEITRDSLRPRALKTTTKPRPTALAKGINGGIWMGSPDGSLFHLAKGSDSLQSYLPDRENLIGRIASLAQDRLGRVWIASTRGLTVFWPKERKYRRFGFDGRAVFPSYLNNLSSPLPDGRLAFSFVAGTTVVDPEKLSSESSENEFPIQVIEIKVLGENVAQTPSENDGSYRIKLPYDFGNLSISFTTPHFSPYTQPQYGYRISSENGKGKWQNITVKQGKIEFPSLSPGEYKIELSASSDSHNYTDSPTSTILVQVSPPFWKTGYAYAFYILLILILAEIYNRFGTLKALLKHRIISIQDKKATQYAEIPFKQLAYDIRSPLSLIKAPLESALEGMRRGKRKDLMNLALEHTNKITDMISWALQTENYSERAVTQSLEKRDPLLYVKEMVEALNADGNTPEAYYSGNFTEEYVCFNAVTLSNLIRITYDNALPDLPSGGRLNFSAKMDHELRHIQITVTYQTDKNTCDNHHKLQNAQHLASSSGGSVEVRQKNGTITYEIRLPFKTSPDPHKSKIEALLISNEVRKPRITIYGEDAGTLTFVQNIMENEYEISTSTIEEKQNLTGKPESSPSLIIIDESKRKNVSLDFCRKLKQESVTSPKVPIVYLSVRHGTNDLLDAIAAGVDVYLPKPFETRVFLAQAQALINQKLSSPAVSDPSHGETWTVDGTFLEMVKSEIRSGLKDPSFGVPALCEKIGLSKTSLTEKLRKATGLSPGELIRYERINLSAILLVKNPKLSIGEVAAKVGYEDVKYFRTRFKEHFSRTPREYRNGN